MPIAMDTMISLVVAALGLLAFVVALNNPDPQKRKISYLLAGVVTAVGLYFYGSSELRGYAMRRRIADIQQRQQVNLEEIQKRLQENQARQEGSPAPARKR